MILYVHKYIVIDIYIYIYSIMQYSIFHDMSSYGKDTEGHDMIERTPCFLACYVLQNLLLVLCSLKSPQTERFTF